MSYFTALFCLVRHVVFIIFKPVLMPAPDDSMHVIGVCAVVTRAASHQVIVLTPVFLYLSVRSFYH